MVSQSVRRIGFAACATLTALFTATAFGAVPVHIVKTDLKAGIRAAAYTPVQFAVPVPHAVSTASAGTWSTQNGKAIWNYAVQVPTAVSLSFHAIDSSLPASATLLVRGAKTTTSYRAVDLHRGELWSRVQPGDALQFTLAVAAVERSKVELNIITLQAGYRSIGPGVSDHPYYAQLKAQAASSTGTAACVVNYECQVTAANTPAAAATVGLIIGNLYECSGSLVNDVPGDNSPYVLTARHCENGQLGGGNPGAASSVTVYWDATSPCGATLGSLYDPGIPTQTGARTVVEQQDAWLILLDVNPVVHDAQFAGFDASGGTVQGGYTIHHAEGGDKQFVEWFGAALAVQDSDVLGTQYVSNFWETINQVGNIGGGASGSGLFDQNNRLVGSLTLGRDTGDSSGYGACPVTPPVAPNGNNGIADFTSLALVWNSTADTTSTTGGVTIKSTLDPGNTGAVVVASAPASVVSLTAPFDAQTIGNSVPLTWDAQNAAQCQAGGGAAGDGWSGNLPASGTQSITENATNSVTYTISCAYAGNRTAHAAFTINWVGPTPQVQFTSSSSTSVSNTVWTTRPATLSWSSNLAPCSISGGGLSLTNLNPAGSTTVTQATPGDVTYSLICGTPNNNGAASTSVSYVTPGLVFAPNSTDRLLGEPLTLLWETYADQCTPTGGTPQDGWSGNVFTSPGIEQLGIKLAAVGTYTYTLACSSGPLSVQKSVQVTVESNAPYVNASVDKSTVTLSDSPSDYITMTYISNLTTCGGNFSGLTGMLVAPVPNDTVPPQAAVVLTPNAPGTYVVTMTCSALLNGNITATSAPITLTVQPAPPPTVAFSVNPATVASSQNFTISWSATNAARCAETGGVPDTPWGAGGPNDFGDLPTGSLVVSSYSSGTYTLGIICQSINSPTQTVSAQATVTIPQLTATLSSNATSLTAGSAFTLTWSSTGATGCAASGGGANGADWSGVLQLSGTATQTATTAGTFTYTITCNAGPALSAAQVSVTVSPSSNAGTSGGGGHGGGGGLGLLELALLAALAAQRRLASVGATAAGQRAG